MIVRTRRFSRLVVCLVGIIAFLLAGCKVDGTVEFHADGRAKIDLTFEDSDGTMTKIHQTCQAFRVMFLGRIKLSKEPKIENLTPPGGHTKCKVTATDTFIGSIRFEENKNSYTFTVPDKHDDDDYSDFKTRIVVTMPGKVIKASKGKVSGNKVIIDTFDFTSRGISITAQKGQGNSADKSAGPLDRKPGVLSSGSGGFPVWGWFGVGAGAAAVVAVVAFAAGRRRRTDD
ncbi:hypothetical protein A4H34_09195 [Peptidiphaga gingivicola]|uniref:Lipoprotein n=1 Tax=Peptidiphaga gingivicola TaxID=2741497 RepID=A0A179B2G7_9ACTO|nr:hypothetical protein [Peptidiphaga gingivicola]OAP85271.1 hypothetical protein A4H34_09195 [Peptidiphaga gingivicola]